MLSIYGLWKRNKWLGFIQRFTSWMKGVGALLFLAIGTIVDGVHPIQLLGVVGGFGIFSLAMGKIGGPWEKTVKNPESPPNKSSDVKYCTECGAGNPKSYNFCRECGTPFTKEPKTSDPPVTRTVYTLNTKKTVPPPPSTSTKSKYIPPPPPPPFTKIDPFDAEIKKDHKTKCRVDDNKREKRKRIQFKPNQYSRKRILDARKCT